MENKFYREHILWRTLQSVCSVVVSFGHVITGLPFHKWYLHSIENTFYGELYRASAPARCHTS